MSVVVVWRDQGEYLRLKFPSRKMNVDIIQNFLDRERADALFAAMEVEWEGNTVKRRNNKTYGDRGFSYDVKFGQNVVTRHAKAWEKSPKVLSEIKTLIEEMYGVTLTYCVAQKYSDGSIGINPHRDKEMKKGSVIFGVSVGQQRTLVVERWGNKKEFQLSHGSLYTLKQPTNDFYSHSIPNDGSVGVRYSLTYRTMG